MYRDTLKDTPSEDKKMIDYVLSVAKFRYGNTMLDCSFVQLLAEHLKDERIASIEEVRSILLIFSIQCDDPYSRPEDFIESVEFSRQGMRDVLTASVDRSFPDTLTALGELSAAIEQDLLSAPVIVE